MAPSFCTDLGPEQRRQLVEAARGAIARGLRDEARRPPAGPAPEGPLAQRLGSFVTLTLEGTLRGCIGSLTGTDPLLHAVADAAHGAAFRDPRFPRLASEEFGRIHIEISVLSPLQPVSADHREELLAQLRPGIDGLLLEAGGCRATFLPKVWEQLPRAEDFLAQLLAKAGLPADYWSGAVRAFRYSAECFGGPAEVRRASPPATRSVRGAR